MYILVVDGDCADCDGLGRRVEALAGHQGLRVISERSAQFAALRRDVGATETRPPCLLLIEDGKVVRQWTGWAMRLRLASLLGVKNVPQWPSLLYTERKARDLREHGGVSRRTLLLGTLSAGVAAALGQASPAAAAPVITQTSAAESARVKAFLDSSASARASVRKWGALRRMRDVKRGGQRYVVIEHESQEFTYTSFAADDQPDDGAVTLVVNAAEKSLDYHLPTGEALASIDVGTGAVRTPKAAVATARESFLTCFRRCVGAGLSGNCAENCLNCIIQGASPFDGDCISCALCAGVAGVTCARDCRNR